MEYTDPPYPDSFQDPIDDILSDKKPITELGKAYKAMSKSGENAFTYYKIVTETLKQSIPPELPTNYPKDITLHKIYSELGRLNVLVNCSIHLKSNSDYLKSAVKKYEALIPLIDIPDIKEIAIGFRDFAKESAIMFEKKNLFKKNVLKGLENLN